MPCRSSRADGAAATIAAIDAQIVGDSDPPGAPANKLWLPVTMKARTSCCASATIQRMDQATASFLAALAAVAGAFVGVWVGGRISANAARDAARIAAEAAGRSAATAREIADADREELQATRFADRVRQLAAEMLDSGDRYLTRVGIVVVKSMGPEKLPAPEFDHSIGRAAQELRLLVRRPETYAETGKLYGVLSSSGLHDRLWALERNPDEAAAALRLWQETWHAYLQQAKLFEDAIRLELGRTPIDVPLPDTYPGRGTASPPPG
jgi:hypothetical protein